MAEDDKKQWAGLECPVCRSAFRIPNGHLGAGVICPACHYLLQIPHPDSYRDSATVMAGETAEQASSAAVGRSAGKTPSPESDGGKTTAWIVGGSILGLIIVGLGVWLLAGSVQEVERARDLVAPSTVPQAGAGELVGAASGLNQATNKPQQAARGVKPSVHPAPDANNSVRTHDSPHAPANGKPHVGRADRKERAPAISR